MPISGRPHRANLVREGALIGCPSPGGACAGERVEQCPDGGTRPVLDGASVA